MDGKGGIVWLHNRVRHLWGWEDRKCQHHSIRVLLPDLGNKKSSHARASATAQRMTYLESCSKHMANITKLNHFIHTNQHAREIALVSAPSICPATFVSACQVTKEIRTSQRVVMVLIIF